MSELLHALESFSFTQNVTAQELLELSAICHLETFFKNTVIFDEHEECNKIFILVEGRVDIERSVLPKLSLLPKKFLTVKSGQIFGEMAFIENGFRSATARAKSNVRIISIDSHELKHLMDSNHSLGYKLMANMARILSRRLRHMNDQWLSAKAAEYGLPPEGP